MPSAYLLDLDGTLYTQAGAIPGAPELVRSFRAKGVPFRLVTNTSSRPRRLLVERLRSYGFEVEAAEIETPIFTAVGLLTERGHRRIAPFLPVGSLEDLIGLELAGGVASPVEGGPPPTAVLVGDLGERWTYALLQEAFTLVMAGAELMALSRDRFWQRADGLALDAGPFVAALEYATTRSATVAGKPSPEFFRAAVAGLPRAADAAAEVVMVGDDLWSDVQGAQRAGYQGWLVRTGKFREDQLRTSGVRPDRVLNSVADLL